MNNLNHGFAIKYNKKGLSPIFSFKTNSLTVFQHYSRYFRDIKYYEIPKKTRASFDIFRELETSCDHRTDTCCSSRVEIHAKTPDHPKIVGYAFPPFHTIRYSLGFQKQQAWSMTTSSLWNKLFKENQRLWITTHQSNETTSGWV